MPQVITKDFLKNQFDECACPTEAVRFRLPRALSSLSDNVEVPLLSPGSKFAIVLRGEDPAGLTLLVRLATSCAEEGARVLFVSHLLDIEEFANLALKSLSKRGEGCLPTRLMLNRLASLGLIFEEANRLRQLDEDALRKLIEDSECDLILVDKIVGSEGLSLFRVADTLQLPVVYCWESVYRDQCVYINGEIGSPTHFLLMDRSLDEEEAEEDDRPDIGMRECRLVSCHDGEKDLELPFKGTFTLVFLEDEGRISDCIDEYGGHMLCSKVECVVIDGFKRAIKEPPYYERKLKLLYEVG